MYLRMFTYTYHAYLIPIYTPWPFFIPDGLQQLGILGEVFAARHQGKTAKVGDNGLHSLRIPVFLHYAPLHLRMSGLGVEKKTERVTQGRNG